MHELMIRSHHGHSGSVIESRNDQKHEYVLINLTLIVLILNIFRVVFPLTTRSKNLSRVDKVGFVY